MIELIYGDPGAGKTSYMVARGIENMYGEKARQARFNCRKLLNSMRAGGFTHVTMAKDHLVYAAGVNIRYISPNCGLRKNHDLDPYRLRLPTDDFKDMQCLLPYSFCIIDEGARIFNSRNSSQFPDNASRYFEQHRKMELHFLIASQRFELIDVNIRALCPVKYIRKIDVKRDRQGNVTKCTWTYDSWQTYREFEKGVDGTTETYTFNGNVFKYYDTHEGKELFLQGVIDKDFEYGHKKDYDLSPDGVVQFAIDHPQEAPAGYYKQVNKGKK